MFIFYLFISFHICTCFEQVRPQKPFHNKVRLMEVELCKELITSIIFSQTSLTKTRFDVGEMWENLGDIHCQTSQVDKPEITTTLREPAPTINITLTSTQSAKFYQF